MSPPLRRWWPLVILIALAGVAIARPGGGESYSGGGGHGGGGGDSGGGDGDIGALVELIYWVIRLCIEYPTVGIPLVVGGIILFAYSAHKQRQNKDWDSGPPTVVRQWVDLAPVYELDPAFSRVVFEDFAFRLFSTAHRLRHSPEALAQIAPYVSTKAQRALASRAPAGEPVVQVIVGAMRVCRTDVPAQATDAGGRPSRVRIGIQFEANVATAGHTYFSVETWLFARDASRHSKPPGVSRTFPCPNCGAPWQASATGTQRCAACGEVVDNGRFDWTVERVEVASIDTRPPTLTTEVPERGTDLPSYRQLRVDKAFAQLEADDPAVTDDALKARLALIYDKLNKAWSNNQLEPARPFVSDGLYDYLQYWIDAYKRQGLRNQLTDMRITDTKLVKIVRDRWYDAITIRIWGTGKDFVVRGETGEIVRGSKRRERPYSEYWTLIRSAQRKGPPRTDGNCANCGAPLHITMAGACDHCGAHVTAGEFDWVLSKIEQDDSYRG